MRTQPDEDRFLDRLASPPAIIALLALGALAFVCVPAGMLLGGHFQPVLLAVAVALVAASWAPIMAASDTSFRSLSWRWVLLAFASALTAIAFEVAAFRF